MNTVDVLRAQLASLHPLAIEIVDDSALHAGHAGAREGGHYRLKIVSEAFRAQSKVARQRLVLQAVGDLAAIRIHALSIQALTPEEV